MKKKVVGLVAAIMLVVAPVALPSMAYAANGATTGNPANDQVLAGAGTTGTSCDGKEVDNIFSAVVRILSIVVGAVAVIMILVGGLKYITSSGDTAKVASAKNTILYAIIGLAVAVLAQVIVNVTVRQADELSKPAPTAAQCSANPKLSGCP